VKAAPSGWTSFIGTGAHGGRDRYGRGVGYCGPQAADQPIPIVMAGASDPVGTGLVASLARPGGNVTGLSRMSTELSGKLRLVQFSIRRRFTAEAIAEADRRFGGLLNNQIEFLFPHGVGYRHPLPEAIPAALCASGHWWHHLLHPTAGNPQDSMLVVRRSGRRTSIPK